MLEAAQSNPTAAAAASAELWPSGGDDDDEILTQAEMLASAAEIRRKVVPRPRIPGPAGWLHHKQPSNAGQLTNSSSYN